MGTRLVQGFTLIELVLTLVLVTILAASIWPRVTSKESLTLNARAEQLASDIRYVQTLAMTNAARYCITLTPISGPPYSGYSLTTAASGCVTLADHPAYGQNQPIAICGSSTCMTAAPVLANDYIQFDGLGAPYSAPATPLAANEVITLTDGSASQTVTVTLTTGRVSVP